MCVDVESCVVDGNLKGRVGLMEGYVWFVATFGGAFK